MEINRTKEKYTFILSLAFMGIGGYKLYQHFYEQAALPMYQLVLAGGLVALGIYQLIVWYLKRKRAV